MPSPPIEVLAWLPAHKGFDLSLRQRRQDVLGFFELRDSRMRTPRAALAVRAARPMQIGIDGADSGIAAGFLEALLPHPQHNAFKLILRGVFRWQPFEGVCVPRYGRWRYVMQVAALPCKLNKAVHVWPSQACSFFGSCPT